MPIEPHIPLKDYNLGKLILALPISLALSIYLKAIQWTLRSPLPQIPTTDWPSGVLIYAFHRDFYFFHATAGVQLPRDRKVVWLGYHGFASYFPVLLVRWNDIHLFRFRHTKAPRPLEQILRYLKEHPDAPFGLLTDAGGPYNRVRPSLLALSQKTDRPIVAMKLRCSHFVTMGNHLLPLPFSRISVAFSTPLPTNTLAALQNDKGTAQLQKMIDEL